MYHHPRSLNTAFVLSDCAVCTDRYGRGVGNTCYYCDDTTAHLLIAMGALFSLAMLLLMTLAVMFLIGGLDTIDDILDQSVGRKNPGRGKHAHADVSLLLYRKPTHRNGMNTSQPFQARRMPGLSVPWPGPVLRHQTWRAGTLRGTPRRLLVIVLKFRLLPTLA